MMTLLIIIFYLQYTLLKNDIKRLRSILVPGLRSIIYILTLNTMYTISTHVGFEGVTYDQTQQYSNTSHAYCLYTIIC